MIGVNQKSDIALCPYLRAHWFHGIVCSPICEDVSGNGNHLTSPHATFTQLDGLNTNKYLGFCPTVGSCGVIHNNNPTYDDLYLSKDGKSHLMHARVYLDPTVTSRAFVLYNQGGNNTDYSTNYPGGILCRILTTSPATVNIEWYARAAAGWKNPSDNIFTSVGWYDISVFYDGTTQLLNYMINGVQDATVDDVDISAQFASVQHADSMFSINCNGIKPGALTASQNGAATYDAGGGNIICAVRDMQLFTLDGALPLDIKTSVIPWLVKHPGRSLPAEVWS